MSEDEAGTAGCGQPGTVWAGRILLTQRLRLRPLVAADAAAIGHLLDDGEMVRHIANVADPTDIRDAGEFIALMAGEALARTGIALAMERTIDGQVVGCIGFGLEHDGNPELGYWVARAAWGQGLATEALRRLVRHLFLDGGFDRVWASVHPDNAASRRVLVKGGLSLARRDGILRQGHAEDIPVYALGRSVWRASHAARPKLLVAAAALVDSDGRVLLASRPPGRSMAGLWEFPGGKIQDGETPEEALVRELAEELGIDTAASCLAPIAFASHDYDTFHLVMPLYVLRNWSGAPTPREGQQLAWVRPGRMGEWPMPPADIPLVALLREWV